MQTAQSAMLVGTVAVTHGMLLRVTCNGSRTIDQYDTIGRVISFNETSITLDTSVQYNASQFIACYDSINTIKEVVFPDVEFKAVNP